MPATQRITVTVNGVRCERSVEPRLLLSDFLRHERQADRQRLHLETADETALRIVRRLVGDDAGHRGTAPHPHRLVEYRVDRPGHVPHVIAADLAGGVGEPVGEFA